MEYEKLVQEERTSLEESLPIGKCPRQGKSLLYKALHATYLALLLLSLAFNGIVLSRQTKVERQQKTAMQTLAHGYHESQKGLLTQDSLPPGRAAFENDVSPYAGVPRDTIKPLVEHTSFHNPGNLTAEHQMWADMDIDYAVVALDEDYIKAKNLPAAQPFPWDRSKHIYVLHGMHNMHCLKILYLAVKQFQANEEQAIPFEHLSHCFDSIRQQLVCDADDTLRASYAGQEGVSGIGQSRKCRNWDMYEQWAKNHTACYHRANKPNFEVPAIDHYKFCPEGSPYVIKNNTLTGL